MIPNLKTALRLGAVPRLAFVGAGGKTTALFQLAREYHSPVLVANTAHTERWQLALADHNLCYSGTEALQLPKNLPGVTLLTGNPNNRSVAGLSSAGIQNVLQYASEKQLPLFIEADGSRRHPVKAPADHEPPVPGFVDIVVVTAGLTAVGHEISSDWVHRPEIFATLSKASLGSAITPEILLRVLCHPSGGLKNIPQSARRVVLLNQADTPELRSHAREMIPEILKVYDAVIVSSFTNVPPVNDGNLPVLKGKPSLNIYSVDEPIAGIILAAGASRRMGHPKLLLPWRGEPLIRHVARTALEAGLSPVLVVVGAYQQEIEAALKGFAALIIRNPQWENGQSTSVRAGIQALPDQTGGAVFLLGDQPQIPNELVRALVNSHAQTQAPVVAPMIAGKRGNPVLFDRAVFPGLLKLSGDAGARQIIGQYPPDLVSWNDPKALLDIDTPEDYLRLVNDM